MAELIPPLVATELLAEPEHPNLNSKDNPYAMPLEDFLEETVALIGQQPTPPEITVERVKAQRDAPGTDAYEQLLKGFTEHLAVLR